MKVKQIMSVEQIKALTDYELQCHEHNTQVDFLDDLSGSLTLAKHLDLLNAEMTLRGLAELPRLNAY